MNKLIRVVAANTALASQQRFRIGCQCVYRHTFNPNIRSLSIEVLAVLGRFLLLGVVACGAESTVDVHCLAEVIPDFLQQGHKLIVNKDRVASIFALKLPDVEVLAQGLVPVLRIGICFDCHCSAHFFLF